MSLYKHYLVEDREQLDSNLLNMHKSLIDILKSTTEADFETADKSLVQFRKSFQIVRALHQKKLKREEFATNEYMRRNYF